MNALHPGTASFALGMASLALGAAFYGLRAVRNVKSAGSDWSIAAIVQGAAWLLAGLHPDSPRLPALLAAALLEAANALFLLRGALRYAGNRHVPGAGRSLALLCLIAAPVAWFTLTEPYSGAHIVLASLLRAPVLGFGAAILWRHAPRHGRAILAALFAIDAGWQAVHAFAPLEGALSAPDLLLRGAITILVIATQFRTESDSARIELRKWADQLETESRQLEQTIEERNNELREKAATDFLTGLPNRRHFLQRAEQEIARARRYGHALSLLMIDIDHFKAINDGFGHPAGDRAIVAVARHCAETGRSSDLAGRLGGEEFAMLLPEAGQAEAQAVAERLRQGAQSLQVIEEGRLVPIRVSIGIACLEAADTGPDTLLARADRALYAAKHAGRDCVRCA
jgi:diguanylate cyclase (GGDEF)-like protein